MQKNFFKRWKKGMMELTPTQQLHAQMAGTIGTIVGILFAWAVMIYSGLWYFSIVMLFAVFLQVISYIGIRQKYKALCQIIEQNKGVD